MWELILCPTHKVELAINDAFKEVPIVFEVNKDYVNIYYFFKQANLKWCLFKCQAKFLGLPLIKYKCPNGTRCVEHQHDALVSITNNLPIFLGFANQQISNPYNRQMKDACSTLQGYMKDNCKLEKLFFSYIKMDILSVMRPISKTFQDNSLLLPEMITVASSTIKTLKKFDKLIRDQEALFKT